MSEEKTLTVAQINKVDIVVIENGDKYIAIKPICEALGVNSQKQIERIKEDDILGQLHTTRYATGSDGKQYEMVTIPFKYVFGWLFSINTKLVSEEARPAVVKFKNECYTALFNHFNLAHEFLEKKQAAINKQFEIVIKAKRNYNEAHTVLKDAERSMQFINKLTIADYDIERRQLRLFNDDEMKGGKNVEL